MLVLFLTGSIFQACDPWDLETTDFPEVTTLSWKVGDRPLEIILEGSIEGLQAGKSVEQYGHIWSLNPNLEFGIESFSKVASGKGNGIFTNTLDGLTPDLTYYYRAFAQLEDKLFLGEVLSFSTVSYDIALAIDSVDQIQATFGNSSAQISAQISKLPLNLAIKDFGIVWADHPEPNILQDQFTSQGPTLTTADKINFSARLIQLSAGKLYARPYISLGDTDLYGPAFCFFVGDIWEQKATIPNLGRESAVSFTINDIGYIGSGRNGSGQAGILSDFWAYDPVSDKWSAIASLPEQAAKREDANVMVIDGKAFLVGGINTDDGVLKDCWAYDPATDRWVQKVDLPDTPLEDAVSFVIGNKGYLGLGQGPQGIAITNFWIFDPNDTSNGTDIHGDPMGKWLLLDTPFPGQTRGDAVGFALNGKGYISTGENDFNQYSDTWEYDPQQNRWAQKANLPFELAREDAVGFSLDINGKAYICTGFSLLENRFLNDLLEFDPEDNSQGFDTFGSPLGKWIEKATFPGESRWNGVAFSILDRGYVGTGQNEDYTADLWAYIPSLNCP